MKEPTYSYTIQQHRFIPNDPTTKRLYKLEELVHEAINRAASELGRVIGYGPYTFWTRDLPHELYSILEGYDHHSSVAAAIGFLRTHGYDVTPTPVERDE